MKRAWALALLVGCDAGRSTTTVTEKPIALPAAALRVLAPARASGALHIERTTDAWIDVLAIGATNAPGSVRGDRVVYDEAFAGTRVVQVVSANRAEELRHVEREVAPLRYRVRLGPGLARLRVVDETVEALDARGVALLRTEPAWLVDVKGRRRDLSPRVSRDAEDWLLEYPIDVLGLAYPLDIDPAWTTTTSLAKARRDNTLHVVASGAAYTIGGAVPPGVIPTSSVEKWDPATGSWTAAGNLQRARTGHIGFVLPTGKLLIVGGLGAPGVTDTPHTAETYDPVTETSSLLGVTPPDDINIYARGVALGSDKYLFAYGGASSLLDLGAGTWLDRPYVSPRSSPTIALLKSGKVLLVGGTDDAAAAMSSADVFDPAASVWKRVAPMKHVRSRPEAVTLASGRVLVAGGTETSTAELYDESTDTWTDTPPMSTVHSYCGMLLLPSGKALIAGGDIPSGLTDRVDLYDPISNTWSLAGKLASPLDEYGFALLVSGKAMIAGGSNGATVATVQLFEPEPLGKTCVGAGECTSGFCVDGFCCDKSACASGETCGGTGAPGTCKKTDGAACAADTECGSAHCIDGVCCDSACGDLCAACDVKGSVGKCVAVPASDAPHGKRGSCPGVDDACRARCGGVDRTKCTQFPGTPVPCAEPACKDGVESPARGCDGSGACSAGPSHACSPYRCADHACKTQCDNDADCADGNTCDLVSRKCVIAATCDGEHTVRSPDGKAKDCTPYLCNAGRCLDACSDSSTCTTGYVCETAAKRCVRGDVAAPPAADSGCAYGRSPSWTTPLFLLALGCLGRRRASARPPR